MVLVPGSDVIDIMLPLAVRTARSMTCCLVPTTWQQQAEGPRADWIANLKRYCNLRTIAVTTQEGQLDYEWIIIDSLAN